MIKRRIFLLLFLVAPFFACPSWAATVEQKTERRDLDGDGRAEAKVFLRGGVPIRAERDRDGDGKVDEWIEYAPNGFPKVIARDAKRHDGKPDYWIYLKDGVVYRREWDRNFDGKPDLITLEDRHHLIEKRYDNNFDGKFEKIVKPPQKGESTEPHYEADKP